MRRIIDNCANATALSEVISVLETRAVALPHDEDATHVRGLRSDVISSGSVTLEDMRRCENVKRPLFNGALRFLGAQRRGLVTDATLFKTAARGHRKAPHLDTNGYEQRILTAILYLNDCESGALLFGHLNAAGRFIEDDRMLPRAGRLVVFDNDVTNFHCVEEFSGSARHNLTSWFRWGSVDTYFDWVLSYLSSHPVEPLRLAVAPSAVLAVARDDSQIDHGAEASQWERCALTLARFVNVEFTSSDFTQACSGVDDRSQKSFLSAMIRRSFVLSSAAESPARPSATEADS